MPGIEETPRTVQIGEHTIYLDKIPEHGVDDVERGFIHAKNLGRALRSRITNTVLEGKDRITDGVLDGLADLSLLIVPERATKDDQEV